MKILVMNGPNINFLGIREKGIYGEQNYEALVSMIEKKAEELGVDVEVFQSNHEGAIIDKIQEAYYNEIINSVIHTGRAAQLIIDFCYLVRRFTVDHLHVVGDIFDRGPYPHLIMDDLMTHHSVDIQWGNHDIVWMGASLGQRGCIAHVVRNCAR